MNKYIYIYIYIYIVEVVLININHVITVVNTTEAKYMHFNTFYIYIYT